MRGWEVKKSAIGAYVPQTNPQGKKFIDYDQFCASQNIPDDIKQVGAQIIGEEVAKRMLAQIKQQTP